VIRLAIHKLGVEVSAVMYTGAKTVVTVYSKLVTVTFEVPGFSFESTAICDCHGSLYLENSELPCHRN